MGNSDPGVEAREPHSEVTGHAMAPKIRNSLQPESSRTLLPWYAPPMEVPAALVLTPIGYVRSILKERAGAPRQGWEGAPDVQIEILPEFVEGLDAIRPGHEIWVFTWLHAARRSVLKVHPRGDPLNRLAGVFATRSPDRPNPIGLHRVQVLEIADQRWLRVANLEAIDETPVIDIKPVLGREVR